MTLVVTVRLARVITEHMIGIKEKKHWACKTYVSIDIRRHRYRFHESCFGALDPALLHCYIETRWNGRTPETGWSFVDHLNHLLIIYALQGFFSWSIAFNCTGLLGAPVIWQYSWRKLRGAVGQWLPTSRWPGALWPLGKMFLTDWDSSESAGRGLRILWWFHGFSFFENLWANLAELTDKCCVALVGPLLIRFVCPKSLHFRSSDRDSAAMLASPLQV